MGNCLHDHTPGSVVKTCHQMRHILDNMGFSQTLVACWATERKHWDTKKYAMPVWRHIDNTVVQPMLLEQCQQVSDPDCSLFPNAKL